MARKNDGILWHLMDMPWWVSVVISTAMYIGLKFIIPAIMLSSDNMIFNMIAPNLPMMAPYFAFLFFIPAPISFVKHYSRKQRFITTTATIKAKKTATPFQNMSWIEFESYIGEFYKSKGYEVKQELSHKPDGGVDIWLKKDGELSLVQCKHWKTRKVGVQVLREMYGVMLANQATRMIIVTSGSFTSEAIQFIEGKRFWLVDGNELVNMIEDGKHHLNHSPNKPEITKVEKPTCPNCQSDLVLRVAKKGLNAGNEFYGCSTFPKCRYTQNV